MILEWIAPLTRIVPQEWRFPAEFNIAGIYLTPIMVVVVAGVLLAAISVWLIDCARLTQFIWHPPLFLFSLAVIYAVLLSLLFMPI